MGQHEATGCHRFYGEVMRGFWLPFIVTCSSCGTLGANCPETVTTEHTLAQSLVTLISATRTMCESATQALTFRPVDDEEAAVRAFDSVTADCQWLLTRASDAEAKLKKGEFGEVQPDMQALQLALQEYETRIASIDREVRVP